MCCSTCATATWCAPGRCRPEPLLAQHQHLVETFIALEKRSWNQDGAACRASLSGAAESDTRRARVSRPCVGAYRAKLRRALCQMRSETTVRHCDLPGQRAVVVAGSRWWELRQCVSMCVSTRRRNLSPSVLNHPLPLGSQIRASFSAMSRRSGFAAEADNHSDISPFRINNASVVGAWLTHSMLAR